MPILNVIKWEASTKELAYKFPSDNLKLGSQLIVYPSQTAFFVKGGKICDEFICGTYTIKSENIPILGALLNLPYGRETPFKADVFFVNNISLLDCKWGTATPLQVEDPAYQVIVPMRAYGQYGIKIINSRVFLERLVGNMPTFTTAKVVEYFRGVILSMLTSIIYTKLKADSSSVLNITSKLNELSLYAKEYITSEFEKYGVSVEMFNIISISVDENDPSFQRLKEAKDAAAKIRIIGRNDYQMARSFDVLDAAAQNESGGIIGTALGMGAGMTAGMGMGSLMGNMAAQSAVSSPQEEMPPVPSAKYYLAIDGKQQGPFSFSEIEHKVHEGEIAGESLVWTKGMKKWSRLDEMEAFMDMFDETPPPIPV